MQRGGAIDGLGLGMKYGLGGLRMPDRAYVLSDRDAITRSVGTGSSGSGGGRKLKKTRLVEGDWELVRTDFEDLARRSKRSSRIVKEQEKVDTVNHEQMYMEGERTADARQQGFERYE